MIVALNVVLAVLVIVGIVGMLARSIAAQDLDARTRPLRSARRARRTSARMRLTGQPVEHRA